MTDPVRLAGFGQANDFLPAARRDPTEFAATRVSFGRALAMAGVGLDDLDFAEVHDCFTIAELIMYEVMGLTAPGQGRRAIEEGWVSRDGKLPVNISGGLQAKGHPVGATGVSQHVVSAMQLTGTAGDMQLSQPRPSALRPPGAAPCCGELRRIRCRARTAPGPVRQLPDAAPNLLSWSHPSAASRLGGQPTGAADRAADGADLRPLSWANSGESVSGHERPPDRCGSLRMPHRIS